MTKMQEIMGKILTNTITRDKANNTLNVQEITITLKIFLAGEDITFDQYTEFTEMLTPSATTDTTQTSTSTTAQTTEANTTGTTTTNTTVADQ